MDQIQSSEVRLRQANLLLLLIALSAALAGCASHSKDPGSTQTHAHSGLNVSETDIKGATKAIDELLTATFKPDGPGAAVLVLHRGQPVLRKAYGLAEVEANKPLDTDQLFRIGSITKQFTAVAALMLVEEGKLRLDDKVQKYLPDVTQDARVTVEHLLTHTSGLAEYTDTPALRQQRGIPLTPTQLIELIKGLPARHAPGERFEYNNTSYMLLGAIIEKLSAQSYGAFVATRIFKPLSMNDTAVEGMQRSDKRVVKGYRFDQGKVGPAPALDPSHAYSAGALVSTLDDLAKWHAAISAGKLLKPETWRQAFTPTRLQVAGQSNTRYGYGWFVRPLRGEPVIEHSGSGSGFASQAMLAREAGLSVILLTNQQRRSNIMTPLAERSMALLLGKPFVEHRAITLSEASLTQFEGTYSAAGHADRTVKHDAAGLLLQSGRATINLLPYSANEFFIPETTLTRYRFERDASNKVMRMVRIGSDDQEDVFTRQ